MASDPTVVPDRADVADPVNVTSAPNGPSSTGSCPTTDTAHQRRAPSAGASSTLASTPKSRIRHPLSWLVRAFCCSRPGASGARGAVLHARREPTAARLRATGAADFAIPDGWDRPLTCAGCSAFAGKVELLESADVSTPMTTGWQRPVILLPPSGGRVVRRAPRGRARTRARPRTTAGRAPTDRRPTRARRLLVPPAWLAGGPARSIEPRASLRRDGVIPGRTPIRLRDAPAGSLE